MLTKILLSALVSIVVASLGGLQVVTAAPAMELQARALFCATNSTVDSKICGDFVSFAKWKGD